jgi:hypothetical protein
MKFHTETIVTGTLILIKTNIPTPPPCPVIAQSVKPAAPWYSILIRLVLFLLSLFRPVVATVRNLANLWPPQLSRNTQQRIAALSFLASVALMMMAESYLEKMIGMMA